LDLGLLVRSRIKNSICADARKHRVDGFRLGVSKQPETVEEKQIALLNYVGFRESVSTGVDYSVFGSHKLP